jgi:hypothetical protein
VLSIGQEAGYLRDMLAIQKERCGADLALVRQGERELNAIRETLKRFEDLSTLAEAFGAGRREADAIRAESARVAQLEATADALGRARTQLLDLGRRAALLEGLPPPEQAAALGLHLARSAERERIGTALTDLSGRLRLARRRHEALTALPLGLPQVASTAAPDAAAKRLASLEAALAKARGRADLAQAGMAEVRAKIADLVEESGGLCPACGHAVDPADLLDDHAHVQVAA